MNRPIIGSISAVFASCIVAFSGPLAANAQSTPSTDLTVDQVRADFAADGYEVGAPVNWWTNDHVTTFTVSVASQQNDRVVLVLVYPDTATAQADTAGMDQLSGPRLVPGYGPALVRHNVALVETSGQELDQRYTAEQALPGSVVPITPAPVTTAVDVEFINALDSSFANL